MTLNGVSTAFNYTLFSHGVVVLNDISNAVVTLNGFINCANACLSGHRGESRLHNCKKLTCSSEDVVKKWKAKRWAASALGPGPMALGPGFMPLGGGVMKFGAGDDFCGRPGELRSTTSKKLDNLA
jgi:hypothetical protein